MCVDEWTYPAGFNYVPPTVQLEMTDGLSPHHLLARAIMTSDLYSQAAQCAWQHACMAMRPFLLKSSSSWSVRVPEMGTAFTDTAMGHAASQHFMQV